MMTSFHQGEDVVFQLSVYTSAAKTTRKDLTGATVLYRIGLASEGITALQVAGSVTDPAEGEIGVTLTDTQTAGLAASTHDHQFIVTQGSDTQVVLAERVKVFPLLPAA